MPSLSAREATEKLARTVEIMDDDDLLDFYNELFPEGRKSELSRSDAGAGDRGKILEYLRRGLAIEEILDLWNVAFPSAHHVYYDDEERAIHYSMLSEATRPIE